MSANHFIHLRKWTFPPWEYILEYKGATYLGHRVLISAPHLFVSYDAHTENTMQQRPTCSSIPDVNNAMKELIVRESLFIWFPAHQKAPKGSWHDNKIKLHCGYCHPLWLEIALGWHQNQTSLFIKSLCLHPSFLMPLHTPKIQQLDDDLPGCIPPGTV